MATTVSTDDIQGLYIAYFNRPADYRGLLFWQQAANNAGGDINAVANAFAASPEYTKAYAGLTNLQIVDQIYVNLFGRHAELDGLNFWADALDNKVLGVGNIAYQIMKGAHDTPGGFQDATAVASKVAAAAAFYDALDTSAEVIAYSGDVANGLVKTWLSGVTDTATLGTATSQAGLDAITGAVVAANQPPVPTQTLTAGADTIVQAGTINGTDATFTAGDKITVTGTGNVLNIADTHAASAAGAPSGVTVSGVQTFNLTSSGNIGTGGQNGAVKQVTTLNLASSTGAQAQVNTYTINASADVTTSNTVTFTYNGQTGTYTEVSGNALATAQAFATALNLLAGTTIANAFPANVSGGMVEVTAPVAGVALPGITTGAAYYVPNLAASNVASHTVNFTYGGVSSSYVESGNAIVDATNLAAAINAIAGGVTVAVATGTQVVLTAPVAGTALPTLSFTAGAGSSIADLPGVVLTTPNTAGSGSATPVAYDVSGYTGLTDFVATSNGTGGDNVKAATTTNVNFTSTNGSVTVTGGLADTIKAAGAVTANKAAGALNITAGGAVTTTEAGADVTITTKGNISAGGGTSLTATIAGAKSTATRAADNTANNTAQSAYSDAQGAHQDTTAEVTALNTGLKAGYTANYASIALNNVATLSALGNGYITAAQKVALDTAFATAFNAATTGKAAAASTAAAAVLAGYISAAVAADAAAAQAETTAGVAANATQQVVNDNNSAAGYSISNTVNTALATATITGNYNGTVAITDGSALQTNLKSVTLNNAGTATLTGNALTTVTISDTKNGVTINNFAIGGHTENLKLNGVTGGSAQTISDASATTVNVDGSGSVVNSFVLTAGAATAVNITGASGVTLGSASTFATNAVITATTSTGTNTITVGAGQSYLGGSGADRVTASGVGGAQTAAVSGGTGTSDRLTVTSNANIATTGATGTGAAAFSNFEILQVNSGVSADVSTFTNSTFTSIISNSATAITGLNATQAAAIAVQAVAVGGLTIGVTGASTVGQLDTVHLTVNNATNAPVDFGTGLVVAGVETLAVTASVDTAIGSLTGAGAITALNLDGAGGITVVTGALAANVNTVIDAHLATGTVSIDASLATTNALRIIGSTTGDNTLIAQNGAFADVIVAGDGTNTILGGAAGSGNTGNLTITAGNGINTITATGGGNEKVTVGNGYNTITTGAGNDTIVVGTGGNVITAGTGADKITLGAHAVGVSDIINLGAGNNVGAAGTNLKTITGFVSGTDVIHLSATALDGLTLTSTSGLATIAAAISDATSVATATDVVTALALDLGTTQLLASTSAANGIVAREVVFTTGAAAGTYLVINDGAAGFDAAHDLVIKLVGNTTFAIGDLHAA